MDDIVNGPLVRTEIQYKNNNWMPLKFVELTNPNNFGGEIWLKAKTKIYFDYELFGKIFSA